MAESTIWMPLMVSTALICPVELTDVEDDSCAQRYGMLWFDVPTALLWVQRPCSVPGEVVICSFRQDTAVAESNTAYE